MSTYDSGTEGSIDYNYAPLWTYGQAVAQRAEESSTCENGVEGCRGPEEWPEWDNADQCPECFEESFYIEWGQDDD